MLQQMTAEEPKFVLQNYQREGLLIIVLGILYLRLILRRRKKERICSRCNHSNPSDRTNCASCSAPLLTFDYRGENERR
jgi:ribosomal protein L40E